MLQYIPVYIYSLRMKKKRKPKMRIGMIGMRRAVGRRWFNSWGDSTVVQGMFLKRGRNGARPTQPSGSSGATADPLAENINGDVGLEKKNDIKVTRFDGDSNGNDDLEQPDDGTKVDSIEIHSKFKSGLRPSMIYTPADFDISAEPHVGAKLRASKAKITGDPFKRLDINPLHEYKNWRLFVPFLNSVGQVPRQDRSGLSRANHKRMVKAVKRARHALLLPHHHHHPIVLSKIRQVEMEK